MYSKINFVIIPLAYLLLSGCATQIDVMPQEAVDIDFSGKIAISSSICYNINLYSLDCPNTDAAIGNIERILFSKDRIFIVDRKNNKAMVFDTTGKFINSTSKYIGHGHNEYIRVSDAAIDSKKSLLYVFCDSPYQIMVFNKDLDLKAIYKTDTFFNEIAIEDNFLYALCQDEQDWNYFELRRYNKNALTKGYTVLHSFAKAIPGTGGLGKAMTQLENGCIFAMPFSNQLHLVHNGEIVKTWQVNLDGQWFSYDETCHLTGTKFLDATTGKRWILQNIVKSDSVLLFKTNKSDLFYINTNKNHGVSFSELINKNIPFSSTWTIPIAGKNGYFATFIYPSSVIRYKENINALDPNSFSEEEKAIQKLISNYTIDSNPLIICYKLK